MPDKAEAELRKCPICDGILDYCHQHGKKSFCKTLLIELKGKKISSDEFIKQLGKKIDIDKMLDHMEGKEKKKVN